MRKANSKIDVVVTWVDGCDPEWLAEKSKYDSEVFNRDDSNNSYQRFRDWGLMKYWFRGMEKYMPFVNKIFFITWGHLPEWLNTDNEKLVVVNHKDYIPKEYLPTYNSNVIEMNIHRIKGLSENFIMFNDDTFVVAPAKETQFFKNDLPCDMLIGKVTYNCDILGVFWHCVFNDLGIINKYFGFQRRRLKDIPKWISPVYGYRNMLRNLNKVGFKKVLGFEDQHLVISHKKSVLEKMWELEYDALDKMCHNRFRSPMDINHWLMRYWNFLTGEFEPINLDKVGEFYSLKYEGALDKVCDRIRKQEKPILVINDSLEGFDYQRFLECQKKIVEAFESIFPERSSFELN